MIGNTIRYSTIFILALIIILILMGIWAQSEETPAPEPMQNNPNNLVVDYDWDRGVYIFEADTVYLKKHPFRRTWIPKEQYVEPVFKELPPTDSDLIKERWQMEQAIEEMGDDVREYYDR